MTSKNTSIVFGGRSPIAVKVSEQLANRGDNVHLVSRSHDSELRSIIRNSGLRGIHECDLQDSAASEEVVAGIISEHGSVSYVAFIQKARSDLSLAQKIRIEVETPFQVVKLLAAQPAQRDAAVVFASSPAGHSILADQELDYHVTKAAIEQLMRFCAVRLGHKVRANCIVPSAFIVKPRSERFYREAVELRSRIDDLIPVTRMGTPVDVASAVSFLLSPESQYVNGVSLAIDGGLSALDVATWTRASWNFNA